MYRIKIVEQFVFIAWKAKNVKNDDKVQTVGRLGTAADNKAWILCKYLQRQHTNTKPEVKNP